MKLKVFPLPLTLAFVLFNKLQQVTAKRKTTLNQKIASKTQRREIIFHVIAIWPNRSTRERNENYTLQTNLHIGCTVLAFGCPFIRLRILYSQKYASQNQINYLSLSHNIYFTNQ